MRLRGVWLIAAGAFALLAAACSDAASAGGNGSTTLDITTPADGTEVGSPFTLEVASSVALGDPSTGNHHVHLCFDGEDCDTEYALVYGSTFEVDDLTPGEHTIEASLRNADHSDAGVTDTITVTVGSGTTNDAGGDSGEGTAGGLGY
ncbi:MAG: DUF4399 domain-containing protein [Actinobacteria bacterium]|nr:DUF4399 domain-containing protein [Actinomycetota bacterium]